MELFPRQRNNLFTDDPGLGQDRDAPVYRSYDSIGKMQNVACQWNDATITFGAAAICP